MIRVTQWTRDIDGAYIIEESRNGASVWSLRQDASRWAGMYYWDFANLRWTAAHSIMDFTTFYVAFEQAMTSLLTAPKREE
jgi:hypothetical protein